MPEITFSQTVLEGIFSRTSTTPKAGWILMDYEGSSKLFKKIENHIFHKNYNYIQIFSLILKTLQKYPKDLKNHEKFRL